MGRLDRSLDRLLADLAADLAGSGKDRLRIRLGDWPNATADCLDLLCAAGLIHKAHSENAIVCDGCDRGCMMEVTWRDGAGAKRLAFIACDKRDDIGRVQVASERLLAWHFSMEGAAAVAAELLGTKEPRPADDGRSWRLGALLAGGRTVEAALCRRADDAPADCGLGIVLDPTGTPAAGRVGLAGLIRFKDHRPVLDKTVLRTALAARVGDPRVACEIVYTKGQIILLNRVTGETRNLARPDFDSANDNIFQTLFDNPDRTYSIAELRKIADKQDLNDLHKIPETLRFKGHLKTLFFRVSKSAITFTRTATFGEMAALGIDPKRI
jgi:hypothetical protein